MTLKEELALELDLQRAVEIVKARSTELQSKHPGSQWKTINGAKVLIGSDGGVVSGAGGNLSKKESGSKEVSKPIKDLISSMISGNVVAKNVTIKNKEKFLKDVQPAIDNGQLRVKKMLDGDNKFRISLGKSEMDKTPSINKDDKSEKESSSSKSFTPTLDTFKEIAKKSKDVKDFMNKVKDIKNVPSEVAEEFSNKYGKDKEGRRLSQQHASQNFIDSVKGVSIKNVDKFSKIKFDHEKTESISEVQKMAKNIDEKHLSSKTKEKLNRVLDEIASNVIHVKGNKFAEDLNNGRYNNNSELLSLLKKSNEYELKNDGYVMEKEDFDEMQDVISEAAKETIQSKTTEKTHKSLF